MSEQKAEYTAGGADPITWNPVEVKLSELEHWKQNPKRLTKGEAARLTASRKKLGRLETIAIGPRQADGKYPLYDGHQRANVWSGGGRVDCQVWALQSDRELTEDERKDVAVLTMTARGSFDWDILSGWDAQPDWGFDVDTLNGWKADVAALGNLIESAKADAGDGPEAEIDRAEELREKWGIELGQLWRIQSKSGPGEHRLICGDCTDKTVVDRVMDGRKADFSFTDPPYNVGVVYKQETNDNQSREDFITWCKSWREYLPSSFCMTVGVKRLLWWRDILGDPQWVISWVKKNGQSNTGLGGTNKWDPILVYGCKPDNDIDIIEVNNDYSEKLVSGGSHPTPKPVILWKKIISRFSVSGATIYEPFDGTGTTIVACEQIARQCIACEISPAYVAVALERLSAMGLEPELIGD